MGLTRLGGASSSGGSSTVDYQAAYGFAGQVRSSVPRGSATASTVLTSGRMSFTAVYYRAGEVATSIGWHSGATAGATLTNCWFGIYDAALNKLAVTSDDTSASWAATTARVLPLAAPVTIATTGIHYHCICVVGTTMPNLLGAAGLAQAIGGAPALAGNGPTARTTPDTAPANFGVFASNPAAHLLSWSL